MFIIDDQQDDNQNISKFSLRKVKQDVLTIFHAGEILISDNITKLL